MGAISRIVVGLDGSEGSAAAAAWCAELAAPTGAQVLAVHGAGKLPEVFRGAPDAVAAGLDLSGHRHPGWKRDAEITLERWCEPLRTAGVPYRSAVVEDDAVHALLHVAAHEHADLIVVGAQGHGGMVGRILGGVTYKLAHHAHVPVVIVPGGLAEG
ncbi:MAG TPA: universal stress protein [Actinomycetota bacterium]|nr:universal stress protein [Actinomycetota bacterium]